VVGGGSIGSRHAGNLRAAGAGEIGVVEPEASRRAKLEREGVTRTFLELEAGLDWSPRLVVVASPTHLHAAQALAAARRGCDLFIEKPLSHSGDGLSALRAEVEARSLVSLVGCNFRFHPGPARVRALLAEGAIGRPLFSRIHAGSYLPSWRPDRDYRAIYSARAAEGGGVLLDFVHEIDLARWYLGDVREVTCVAGRLSRLEIDSEDWAAMVFRHEEGPVSEIHLDYVQRSAERGCQIAGEEGSLFWDLRDGRVRLYRAAEDSWQTWEPPAGWELNRMYEEEVAHLLACVRERRPTVQSVADAIVVMRLVEAARESARTGRAVSTAQRVPA
jgi:predicted dehydrogenase